MQRKPLEILPLFPEDSMLARISSSLALFPDEFHLREPLPSTANLPELLVDDVDVILLSPLSGTGKTAVFPADLPALVRKTAVVLLVDAAAETPAQEAVAAGAHDYLLVTELTPRTLARTLWRAYRLQQALQNSPAPVAPRRTSDSLLPEQTIPVDRHTLLQHTFRAAPIGMGLLARNRAFVMVNEQFCHIVGYSEGELVGAGAQMLYATQAEFERVGREKFAQLAQRGRAHVETQFRHKDGHLVDVWLDTCWLQPGDPDAGLLATAVDVTAYLQAERKLRQSEAQFRAVWESAYDAMVLSNGEGIIINANQAYLDLYGYTREEVVGNSFAIIFPEAERESAMAQYREVFAGVEDPPFFEATVTRGDGTERIVESRVSFIREQERRVAMLSTIRDVTDRKQTESALRASEERFRQLYQSSPVAAFVWQMEPDNQFRLVDVNEAAGSLTEGKARDFVGLYARQIYPDRPDILRDLRNCARERRTLRRRFAYKARGTQREMVVIFTYAAVAPDIVLLHTEDITEKVRDEEQARHQERLAAVGHLAAGIAHDFNNILSVIHLYGQLLQKTTALSAMNQTRLNTILQQTQQAGDLIQQILDFSRLSVLEKRPLNLVAVVKEMSKLLTRTFPENITIRLYHEADDYLVHADLTRIQQMLLNLCVNARDAMPQGGSLSIRLAHHYFAEEEIRPLLNMPAGDWIQISLQDTGVGIPPENLSRIFDPFFTTKEAGQGTGLGMAQVYGIVTQHDGYIDVVSSPGTGTTFTIYLPAIVTDKTPHAGDLYANVPYPSGNGERVLVVEDEFLTRRALAETLSFLGYETVTAKNGVEALALLEGQDPDFDLILSDVIMPQMGGEELLQELRQRDVRIPIVMMSGYMMQDNSDKLVELGVEGWLAKPPELQQLGEVVARVLQEKRAAE